MPFEEREVSELGRVIDRGVGVRCVQCKERLGQPAVYKVDALHTQPTSDNLTPQENDESEKP